MKQLRAGYARLVGAVVVGLLAAACGAPGGADTVEQRESTVVPVGGFAEELDPDDVSEPSEWDVPPMAQPAPALVEATLELRGSELVVKLQNPSAAAGLVSATANVMNARGMFHTQRALDVRLQAGETRELVLSSSDVLGLDLFGDDWSKVTLNYGYELEDGERGGDWRSLFVEGGAAVPEHRVDVVNANSFGYPEEPAAAPEAEVDKQATFTICFENEIDLFGGAQSGLQLFPAATARQRIHGQLVDSLRQGNDFFSVGDGSRLNSGCTVALPRRIGSWSATVFATATDTVNTIDLVGPPSAQQAITFDVSATSIINNVHVQRFRFTGTDNLALHQAFVITQGTLLRMNSGGLINDLGNKRLDFAINTDANVSQYFHLNAAGTAVKPTMRIRSVDASKRSVVTHETGHFIQLNLVFPTTRDFFAGDDTYTNPAFPIDSCQRSSTQHALASLEFRSTAHIEAMGHFIVALTYNNFAAAGTVGTCRWPDFGPSASCSGASTFQTIRQDGTRDPRSTDEVMPRNFMRNAPAKPPRGPGCAEVGTATASQIANEVDWTRHLWDFFSQNPRPDVRSYYTKERSVCGSLSAGQTCNVWTRTNHLETIRGKLSATEKTQWDGAATRNLQ